MNNEPLLVVMLCIVVLGVILVQAMWLIVHSLMEIFKNVRYGKVEKYHIFIVIFGLYAEIQGLKIIISLCTRFIK